MVQARFINDTNTVEVRTQENPSRVNVFSTAGIKEHNLLINRDLPDQHPMSAITGLENSLDGKQDTLSAGDNIQIEAGVISASAEWGNITGTLSDQTDLNNALGDLSGGIESNHQAISDHVSNKNNPHEITKAQVGLGNVDNTSDLNKPISTATQTALDNKADTSDIPTQASDVHALPDSTKYGASISLTMNDSTYVITLQLKDQDGNNIGSAQTIDLPLESVVVSGSYDDETKKIILTLQNGSTIEFSVADLVSGLQTEITSSNKLSADLVDDTNTTNKFVTASEKTAIGTALQPNDNITELTNNAGYITGITSSDVTSALGYTPYDSSNPSGYTDNVGTVTSVNNTSPDSNGNVTLSIPAAQVNSDWNAVSGVAEILNKPTLGTMASESASDYTPTSGLATVATSGAYGDLSGTPTIPTVNNVTISFTQGGVLKGSFTLNQATGQTIALDAGGGGGGGSYTAGDGIDITSNVISVTAPTLTNTATGTDSLTILGTAVAGQRSVNIGSGSKAGGYSVVIGCNATNGSLGSYNVAVGYKSEASANIGYSVALGNEAKTTANYAIQIGYGTNSEANSFYVATSSSHNWKMLGDDGLIPSGRIPISTSVDSSSTNSTVVGAKLFYDTCGDIETLINAL